ncbi:MAG: hypothetical protein ABR577_13860 [Pyrinomonadaceae bacterium]
MKTILSISGTALLAVALAANVCAQNSTGATASSTTTQTNASAAKSDITATYALGDVTGIDAANKQITLHTTAGDLSVLLSDATKYKRVAPEAKSLENAEVITLADVGVGDRIIAQGKVAADRKSVPARQVVVMSKAALAVKREHDREEWRRRGIVGRITAINTETKEITVATRSREGERPLIIAASDKVNYRRYAPDSVKFDDAKQSSLAELKIGDQLRALGERSSDGARFTPEEIVSGSFRMAGGTVTAVNAATGEIKIKTLQGQPLTVVVNEDSALRRIPAELAAMVAMRRQGGGTPPAGFGGGGNAPGGQSAPGGNSARPPVAREGAPGGADRPRVGGGAGGGDLQQMIERLPAISASDLKPGDMILVSSTNGADPTRVTAITLAAGVEALLRSPTGAAQAPGGNRVQNTNIGLPADVLGGGIGLP